jgi:DNA-binding CsgD family transcriptional regulator
MVPSARTIRLLGREQELAAIDFVLDQARAGISHVMIVGGEAGIGKSALLAVAAERARDMRVLQARGVESEISMPFAGLHQLLWPIIDQIDRLTPIQAAALTGALGLSAKEPGSLFLVGAALLTLLAEVAEEKPLLFMIDDAHWLDEPSAAAISFAARRLESEPVAGLIAVREGSAHQFSIPEVAALHLKGLDAETADRLLRQMGTPIAPEVRQQLIAESAGNLLALTELPAALTPAQLAAKSPLPNWIPLPERLFHAYQQRIQMLSSDAKQLLLLAAADGLARISTLMSAAARLGISNPDLGPAEHLGLITVLNSQVSFRYHLIRSAVYQGGSQTERLRAHRALADALEQEGEEDRRAWHLAAATVLPNEEVAAALEAVADRSERHRGPATAAASLERAAELTADEGRRSHRLARAASANLEGGRRDRALALLDEAEQVAHDPRVRAEILFSRARLNLQTTTTTNSDIQSLLDGARLVKGSDPRFAANMLSLASYLGWHARDWSPVLQAARKMLELELPDDDLFKNRARDLISVLEAGGSLTTGNLELPYAALLQYPAAPEVLTSPPLVELSGNEAAAYQVLQRAVADYRARGTVWGLMSLLNGLSQTEYLLGRWSSSVVHLTEALSLARQAGHEPQALIDLSLLARLAAVRGEADRCRELTHQVRASEFSHWLATGFTCWSLALLGLAEGHGEEAVDALLSLSPIESWPNRSHIALRTSGDLVEAALLRGKPEIARQALEGLARWAGPHPPAWAAVTLNRSRGLLAADAPTAEAHFQAAISIPQGDRRPWDQGRSQLAYGEWLRRHRRRVEARTQLRAALDIFERLGAHPWSDRARAELRSTGEKIGKPTAPALEQLTPQELQIARLASMGLTNRQIGAQLFLSPRTVGTHLYRLFPKLGIVSRVDLRELDLDDAPTLRIAAS